MSRLTYCCAVLLCLGVALTGAQAQEPQTQESEAAQPAGGDQPAPQASPAAQPAPEPTEAEVRARLEQAFKREFAFLVEQRAQLKESLAGFRSRSANEVAQLEAEIQTLQQRIVSLNEQQREAQQNLQQLQERSRSTASARQVLEGTFGQAESALSTYGIEKIGSDAFTELSDQQKVRTLFATARGLIQRRSDIHTTPGVFFDRQGARVEGQLIKVGGIAAYGVADQAAGVLAPAGGGRYKVWAPQPASEVARALGQGVVPTILPMFLYESLDTNAADAAAETIIEHVDSGGTIAWVIVALGAFAALLILIRALYLWRASSRTGKLEHKVGDLVHRGNIDDALEQCRRFKGSAARVVAAALRNMGRDREHLEDIISESILAESSRLNRLAAMIMVIAAVSPLLGLLGTVTGMISVFDVITKFGTGDPKLLSGGISTALVTTELGLMVAIPVLLLGNVLSSWAERIKDSMEKAALRITNLHYQGRDDGPSVAAYAGSPA